MPGILKNLIARLKHRRRAQSQQRNGSMHSQSGNSMTVDDAVTEQVADLSIASPINELLEDASDAHKPHIFGEESFEFEFEFDFTEVELAWPGPSYDEKSLFAPGTVDKARPTKRRPKQKSSKRRLSQEDRQATPRSKDRHEPTPTKAITRAKKISLPRPQYYGSPQARDPPLHLLNLPGEIRNQVYRLLCLHKDPMVAEFRLIIKPKQGPKKRANNFRRFPREPGVALVCKQVQKEALSLFYSENKFVFRKSDIPVQHTPTMTKPENIDWWQPKWGFADSLTNVQIEFRVREPSYMSSHITYTFRKSAEGTTRISESLEDDEYCKCFEAKVLQTFRESISGQDANVDIVTAISTFTMARRWLLQNHESMTGEFPYTTYRPARETCGECGLEPFREVGSGM